MSECSTTSYLPHLYLLSSSSISCGFLSSTNSSIFPSGFFYLPFLPSLLFRVHVFLLSSFFFTFLSSPSFPSRSCAHFYLPFTTHVLHLPLARQLFSTFFCLPFSITLFSFSLSSSDSALLRRLLCMIRIQDTLEESAAVL